MIRFTLKCDKDHSFDSWFQSTAAYEKLQDAHMVACAVCGSVKVNKDVMAPRVRPARSAATAPLDISPPKDTKKPGPLSAPASPAEQAMAEIRKKIEANTEDVGSDFAREARAIHDGDAPERAIMGEAKAEDAKSLIDDGIPVAALPWSGRKTN